MAPGESNGHVTRNVTWPRQLEVVTPICWGPLPKIWLEIRVELWLHVTLNFYTYRSSIYIRIEISYECYRWHWTDSVFFRTLSCYENFILITEQDFRFSQLLKLFAILSLFQFLPLGLDSSASAVQCVYCRRALFNRHKIATVRK